jgi:hypothetical protein
MTEIITLCPYHISDCYGTKRVIRNDQGQSVKGRCVKCGREGYDFVVEDKELSR